jgi:hypothetical protein
MNNGMDIPIPPGLCKIKLRESTPSTGLITIEGEVVSHDLLPASVAMACSLRTASVSVQRGPGFVCKTRSGEAVVQIVCPVSHFAVASYFEEAHYSVLRPIKGADYLT